MLRVWEGPLRPGHAATQRTKARIREHGPDFVVEAFSRSVVGFKGRECIRVRSSNVEDDWLGWLPLDELDGPDIIWD